MSKKLKVVWICHFTNDTIQQHLKPRKKVAEFAPWITFGIKEAEKRNDIELHIVSPHKWISKNIEFKLNNIYYHFFNPGIPFYGRHWPSFFRVDIFTNFWLNKKQVKNFINKIDPDIIHLHGIENPYYSSTVFQFINSYPILVTIQGINLLHLSKIKMNADIKLRYKIGKEILIRFNNFGIRTKAMTEEILTYNINPNFYWHEYFINIPSVNSNFIHSEKKYDIIFFARIDKTKGIEDLIKVIGMLKKKKFKNINVAVIGSSSKKYLSFLKTLAKENNCLDNISFIGFLPTQEDIYKILDKSKICVLPTYNDTIPGTIIESMFRKVPVVSYKTGGIPDINENDEYLLLNRQGDLEGLMRNIEKLMDNEYYRKKLAEKAYEYAIDRWNNEKAIKDIILIYKKILKNFN